MSLSVIPNDPIYFIACHLSIDPKSLVFFGETEKRINQITKDKIFDRVFLLGRELFSANKRIYELRGPSNPNGLLDAACLEKQACDDEVEQGYIKLVKNEAQARYRKRRGMNSKAGPSQRYSTSSHQNALTKQEISTNKYNTLKSEFDALVKFNEQGEIVGGRVVEVQEAIVNEHKRLLNLIKQSG